LLDTVQRAATQAAKTPPGVVSVPAEVRPGGDALGQIALRDEIEDLVHALALEDRHARERGEELRAGERPPFTPILDQLVRGQLVFFLGAGALLRRLPLAREFYGKLRDLIEAPRKLADEKVVQHFVDVYGRDALDRRLHDLLDATTVNPTAVHWLITTVTARLRAKGYRATAPLIVTTNFDQTMERALSYSGQRYHLFTYRLVSPGSESWAFHPSLRLTDGRRGCLASSSGYARR
jgi:hypothetical protein